MPTDSLALPVLSANQMAHCEKIYDAAVRNDPVLLLEDCVGLWLICDTFIGLGAIETIYRTDM